MAPLTSSSTNGSFRIFVVTVAATASNVFHAVLDACERVYHRVRDFLYEEPLLPRIVTSCPPVIADERVVARSGAPIASFEPAFVGAGLAFRRWR